MKYIDPSGMTPESSSRLSGLSSRAISRKAIIQPPRKKTTNNTSIKLYDVSKNVCEPTPRTKRDYFKDLNEWLNSTEPLIKHRIPSSKETIDNVWDTLLPDWLITDNESLNRWALSLTSSLEEYLKGKTGKSDINLANQSTIKEILENFEKVTGKKIKNISVKGIAKGIHRTTSSINIVFFVADLGNTWSDDNGNTNAQRMEKTAVQVTGFALNYGVDYIAGMPLGAVIGTGQADPIILAGAGGVTVVISFIGSYAIDNAQNKWFEYRAGLNKIGREYEVLSEYINNENNCHY